MTCGIGEIRWAPRVNPSLIRRLYETDALGIVDSELIDKVGFALYARCQSILQVTEAHEQRHVRCPQCGQVVVRPGGPAEKHELIVCGSSTWTARWGDYLKTYQDKRLHGGGAVALFQAFIAQFESSRSPQEKMLAIDRLIHSFHWELVQNPGRTAATNVIYAKNKREILAFLDSLAYGDGSTPGLREGKREWERKLKLSNQPQESSFLANRGTGNK
jgi:ribosomal protein S27E